MSPSTELAAANISPTDKIELIDGRQAVKRRDGTVFFLDQLGNTAYWAYMSLRENSWYKGVASER